MKIIEYILNTIACKCAFVYVYKLYHVPKYLHLENKLQSTKIIISNIL